MDTYIKDLINYNSWANQQLIDIVTLIDVQQTDKCIKLISHILNVHHIWNSKINSESANYGAWTEHPLASLVELNSVNTEATLAAFERFGASRIIEYQTGSGALFRHFSQEIILQIITHSTYHRGQIATELRSVGIQPPLTDFIYYKMILST